LLFLFRFLFSFLNTLKQQTQTLNNEMADKPSFEELFKMAQILLDNGWYVGIMDQPQVRRVCELCL
jgi:hypothetical protein